tara:strand:- start:883 stop:1863 length:981 start_codon:yes stop_codon:yes gene_type:complete
MVKGLLFISLIVIAFQTIAQGPYAPHAGQTGTTAIHKDSTAIVFWATTSTVTRGLQNASNVSLGNANVGTSGSATGKSGLNGIVSLGDGGSATLTFNAPIINGAGADFAVFENSFNNTFLELAFVEVSSDGTTFFRFDAISLTDASIQLDNNAVIDATNIYNLAGKYRSQYGTPFDLDELAGTPGLNVNNITHIKIIDVVGSINPLYATFDSQNNPINDPWPTAFGSSGFDLDAVGVINSSATAIYELANNNITIFPNPIKDVLNIQLEKYQNYEYAILNLNGKTIESGSFRSNTHQVKTDNLGSGVYFLQLKSSNDVITKKMIKF